MRWWRNLCDSCPCQNVFKERRQECEGLNSCHNSTPVLTGSTFLLGSTSTEFDTDFNGKRNDGGVQQKLDRNIMLSLRNKEKEKAEAP